MKGVFKRFQDAGRGLFLVFREPNAKIHALAAIFVAMAGWYMQITRIEWCIIILVSGAVFAAETFNTAIEELANKVEPQSDPMIRNVKDLAAGAVLWLSIAALLVGLVIFLPKVM